MTAIRPHHAPAADEDGNPITQGRWEAVLVQLEEACTKARESTDYAELNLRWRRYGERLQLAMLEIEERTRPDGDMADAPVNALTKNALLDAFNAYQPRSESEIGNHNGQPGPGLDPDNASHSTRKSEEARRASASTKYAEDLVESLGCYLQVLDDSRKPLAERAFARVALPNLEKRLRATLARNPHPPFCPLCETAQGRCQCCEDKIIAAASEEVLAVFPKQAGEAVNRYGDKYAVDATGKALPYTEEELEDRRRFAEKGTSEDRYLSTIDALRGCLSQGIRQPAKSICVGCDGCGWCEGSPAFKCERCNGTGEVTA